MPSVALDSPVAGPSALRLDPEAFVAEIRVAAAVTRCERERLSPSTAARPPVRGEPVNAPAA